MALGRIAFPLVLSALLASSLGACGTDKGAHVPVAVIDTPEALDRLSFPWSVGAQHLQGATMQGLVSLDAKGDIVPAIADRWIVTEDGRNFIFRLQSGEWPDGKPYTAESVAAALRKAIKALNNTSFALDLAPIADIRPMAGRVIEIRLTTPVPMLLQLLAQPELAFQAQQSPSTSAGIKALYGTGPMELVREGESYLFTLKPPLARGIPEDERWAQYVRPVDLRASGAAQAMEAFRSGAVDVVLGGTLGWLPLANTALLSRGTIVYDPALGLFGLRVLHEKGFLSEPAAREVLALALDRTALMAPFNLPAWQATTRIVPQGMPEDRGLIGERWTNLPLDQRKAQAKTRVDQWLKQHAPEAQALVLSLRMEQTPGNQLLVEALQRELAPIGIALVAAEGDTEADLELVDRVARYASPRWFLNQFHCSLKRGLCSAEADAEAALALVASDAETRDAHLTQAEAHLTRANVYIPLGAPVRWSLVRSTVARDDKAYAPNPWAFHPLSSLATLPK